MSGVTLVNDATHQNISHLPPGMGAGYSTGSVDVKWTNADWASRPNAIRYCQDSGSDVTADLIDVERFAATVANAVSWLPKAQAAYRAVKRPGQRWPGVYISYSRLTELANGLAAALPKLTYVPLVLARWDNNEAADAATILARSGPFPIVGFQYANAGLYDQEVISSDWLNEVAHIAIPRFAISKLPPGRWLPGVRITDNTWHSTSQNGADWTTPSIGA